MLLPEKKLNKTADKKSTVSLGKEGVDVNREICKIYGTAERVGGRINKRRSIMRKKKFHIYIYMYVYILVCLYVTKPERVFESQIYLTKKKGDPKI